MQLESSFQIGRVVSFMAFIPRLACSALALELEPGIPLDDDMLFASSSAR